MVWIFLIQIVKYKLGLLTWWRMTQRLVSEENEQRMYRYIFKKTGERTMWMRGHPAGMSFNDCLDVLLDEVGF